MRNKSAVCLAAITLAAFAACVDPTQGELGPFCPESHFLFELVDDDTAVMITGYVGGRADVRIPPYIRGLPVTVIGNGAFGSQEVWDEEHGWYVIANLHQLTSVTIPNGVTAIWGGAFFLNLLTSVAIPDSVVTIGSSAFQQNRLASVTIGNGVTVIGGSAFSMNQLTSLYIPYGVTNIGSDAFALNQLASVTIPYSVIYINGGAFRNNQLVSVTVPNSEAVIRPGAFGPDVKVTIGTDQKHVNHHEDPTLET